MQDEQRTSRTPGRRKGDKVRAASPFLHSMPDALRVPDGSTIVTPVPGEREALAYVERRDRGGR